MWLCRFVVLPGDEELRPPGILLEATHGSIVYKQEYPVVWNSPAKKNWNIELDQTYICFLNAHRTLVSELLADWSKGAPHDAKHFCPQHTTASVKLANFSMRMNGNVDNMLHDMKEWGRSPAAQQDVMVVLEGPLLHVQSDLPRTSLIVRNEYKSTHKVQFPGGLSWAIQFPERSMASENRGAMDGLVPVLRLEKFELELSTTYHGKVTADHSKKQKEKQQFTDRMEVNMQHEGLKMVAQGDLICYLTNWWDNYFGAAKHGLISYQEYIENNCRNIYAEGAAEVSVQNTRDEKNNPTNMYLVWSISDIQVVLPALMYDEGILEASALCMHARHSTMHTFTSL